MDSEVVDSKAVDANNFDFDNVLNKDDYEIGSYSVLLVLPSKQFKR